MLRSIGFLADEDGAVTVDWVVITAAVVGLGALGYNSVSSGVGNLSGDIATSVSGVSVSTGFGTSGNTTAWSGNTASDYIAAGQELAPGNNGAVSVTGFASGAP